MIKKILYHMHAVVGLDLLYPVHMLCRFPQITRSNFLAWFFCWICLCLIKITFLLKLICQG